MLLESKLFLNWVQVLLPG